MRVTSTWVDGKAPCIAEQIPLTETPHSNWSIDISLIRAKEMAVCGRLGEPGHKPKRMSVACSVSHVQNVHRTRCTLAATKWYKKWLIFHMVELYIQSKFDARTGYCDGLKCYILYRPVYQKEKKNIDHTVEMKACARSPETKSYCIP